MTMGNDAGKVDKVAVRVYNIKLCDQARHLLIKYDCDKWKMSSNPDTLDHIMDFYIRMDLPRLQTS